jgi:hypothetical protein
MQKKTTRIPAAIYTVLSAVALPIWLGFLFFAFFLGGSPGPDYERSVPYSYVGVMTLGFSGTVLALAAGITGLKAKPVKALLPFCAVLLGVMGSMPFFWMDLAAVGLFALLPGALPSLLYLLLIRKRSFEKTKR